MLKSTLRASSQPIAAHRCTRKDPEGAMALAGSFSGRLVASLSIDIKSPDPVHRYTAQAGPTSTHAAERAGVISTSIFLYKDGAV